MRGQQRAVGQQVADDVVPRQEPRPHRLHAGAVGGAGGDVSVTVTGAWSDQRSAYAAGFSTRPVTVRADRLSLARW